MLGFFSDALFGEEIKVVHPWYANKDDAPILRLNEAILQQAITDKATKIFLRAEEKTLTSLADTAEEAAQDRVEPSEFEQLMAEAKVKLGEPEEHAEPIPTKGASQFAKIMAEAGVRPPPDERVLLSVYYEIEGEVRDVMTIPGNLLGPCVRAYRYKFNWQNCVSNEKPNGLLYRKGYFLELKTLDLKAAPMVVIDVTPDPDP